MSRTKAGRGRTPYVPTQGRRIVRAGRAPPQASRDPKPRSASYHRPTMQPAIDITRRSFLVHAGRGTIALAVLGVAGCGPSTISSAVPSSSASPGATPEPSGSTQPSASTGGGSSSAPPRRRPAASRGSAPTSASSPPTSSSGRGEAAIVDTGVGGSEGPIHDALVTAGVDWAQVGHVVLTHKHGDHAGSIGAILGSASGATGYAGEADLPRSLRRARSRPSPTARRCSGCGSSPPRVTPSATSPCSTRRAASSSRATRSGRRPASSPAPTRVHRGCGGRQGVGGEAREAHVRDAAGRPRRADPGGGIRAGGRASRRELRVLRWRRHPRSISRAIGSTWPGIPRSRRSKPSIAAPWSSSTCSTPPEAS